MVAFVCPAHGHSLHYQACRHVQQAVTSAPHVLPPIGTLDRRVICQECLTPEVEKLLEQYDRPLVVDQGNDEALDEAIANFGTALEALRAQIGYQEVCTECLYERTGLDLRRKSTP